MLENRPKESNKLKIKLNQHSDQDTTQELEQMDSEASRKFLEKPNFPHSPNIPVRVYKTKNLSPFTQTLLSGGEIPPLLIPTKNYVYQKKQKKNAAPISPNANQDIKELLAKPKKLSPIRPVTRSHRQTKVR
jgi:hypothetical protein